MSKILKLTVDFLIRAVTCDCKKENDDKDEATMSNSDKVKEISFEYFNYLTFSFKHCFF